MTIVAVPAIRDLGTVPNNNMDESTFNSASESFTSNIPPWGGDLKAVADSAKTNAEHSHAKAGESAASAQTAADRLADVNSAASGAFAAANYKGEWSGLAGALNLPATVTHQGRLWYLKSNLANVATQPPALGSAYWGEVSRNDFQIIGAGAGNTNAVDRGFYRMTAGSATVVLPRNPFHGMQIGAVNLSGLLTAQIDCNFNKIMGRLQNLYMDQLGVPVSLQFDAGSGDWLIVNGITTFTPYSTQQPFNSANAWSAAQTFGGGAALGDGPIIKEKRIAFNAPAAGAQYAIPLPIVIPAGKIVDCTAMIVAGSFAVRPNHPASNTTFTVEASSNMVYITLGPGASAIAGQSGTVYIKYTD